MKSFLLACILFCSPLAAISIPDMRVWTEAQLKIAYAEIWELYNDNAEDIESIQDLVIYRYGKIHVLNQILILTEE